MPQATFAAAMGTRDALLPEWHKSLATFKVHAAAAWHTQPGVLKALFSAPPPLATPKRRAKVAKDKVLEAVEL